MNDIKIVFAIKYQISSIQYPVSSIKYQVLSIKNPVSRVIINK